MRRVFAAIGFSVLIFSSFSIAAGDRYFYESGKILPGEEWSCVYVYNNSTIVDMTGGTVASVMESHDSSTVNISGGNLLEIEVQDSSILNISNGHVSQLWTVNESMANIAGGTFSNIGSFNTARINMYAGNTSGMAWINGESIFSMYDGIIDRIAVNDTSKVNLRGGQITS